MGRGALRPSSIPFCIAILVTAAFCTHIVLLNNLKNKVEDSLVVNVTDYPFNFTMTLEKAEYALGEHVKVKLRLTYIGDENITTLLNSPPMFDFDVHDAQGRHIYKWTNKRGFICLAINLTWSPGKYIEETLSWEQTIHDYEGEQAPPGVYYITGRTYIIELQTPPIYIRLEDS